MYRYYSFVLFADNFDRLKMEELVSFHTLVADSDAINTITHHGYHFSFPPPHPASCILHALHLVHLYHLLANNLHPSLLPRATDLSFSFLTFNF